MTHPTAPFGAQYIRFAFRHQVANPKYVLSFAIGVLTVFWIMTLIAGYFLKNEQANVVLFLLVFSAGSALVRKSTWPILGETNRQDALFALGLSEEYRRSLYLYRNLYRLSLLLLMCLLCNLLSVALVKPSPAITGYCTALMLAGYLGQALWLPGRSRKAAMGLAREETEARPKDRRGAKARSIRFPVSHPTASLFFYQSLAGFRRDPVPFAVCFLGMPLAFAFLRCAYPGKVDPGLALVVLALASVYPLIGLNRDIAEQDFWGTALPYSPMRFFAKNAVFFSLVWAVNAAVGLASLLLPGAKGTEYLLGAAYSYPAGLGAVGYVTARYRYPSHCFQAATLAGIALFYLYLLLSRS